jgi:resuscitation-promoting factor RpfB
MRKKFERYAAIYRESENKHIRRFRWLAQHPIGVPVFTVAGLLVLTGILFIVFTIHSSEINPNVVRISHDGQTQIVSSEEPSVGALLKKVNITINDGDVVEPALNTLIQQDDFRINIYRAMPITIVEGGQRQFVFSAATTPRSIARQAGLTIYPEDNVQTEPVRDFVTSGDIAEQVIVDRSVPVFVNFYGAQYNVRTQATTVRELIKEKKVNIEPKDIVSPSLDAPIVPNGRYAVIRNGITTITVEEIIPTPQELIPDNNLSYGVSAVRQQGAPGKRAVTYEVNTQNGVEIGRREIQQVIIQPPVAQITVQGTSLSGIKGDMALAGIAPSDYQYADHIISNESGWCPTKWQGEWGKCPPYHGTPTSPSVGYGLCQATPGSKMATAGADWGTNPVTQLRWCSNYATSKYGSWRAAYNFWLSHHWW